MSDGDGSAAGGNRRSHDAVDSQQVPANGGAHNIGDRVDGADLVEVDLADGCAMHLRFRLAKPRENAFGQVLLPRRKLAAFDHLDNVVQMPVRVFGLVPHVDVRGAKAFAFDVARRELASDWQPERIDAGLDGLKVDAGVHKRRECHIAADAADEVEVGDSHGKLRSKGSRSSSQYSVRQGAAKRPAQRLVIVVATLRVARG